MALANVKPVARTPDVSATDPGVHGAGLSLSNLSESVISWGSVSPFIGPPM
jgi:hypothetical protein